VLGKGKKGGKLTYTYEESVKVGVMGSTFPFCHDRGNGTEKEGKKGGPRKLKRKEVTFWH